MSPRVRVLGLCIFAFAAASAWTACRPGSHPPPPKIPKLYPEPPESEPPTPHDPRLLPSGDAGL